MTKYAEQVANLATQIFDNQYFPDIWYRVMLAHGMTAQGIAEQLYEDEALAVALFDVWDALPDAPHIRTGPFFLLCDLCEGPLP